MHHLHNFYVDCVSKINIIIMHELLSNEANIVRNLVNLCSLMINYIHTCLNTNIYSSHFRGVHSSRSAILETSRGRA